MFEWAEKLQNYSELDADSKTGMLMTSQFALLMYINSKFRKYSFFFNSSPIIKRKYLVFKIFLNTYLLLIPILIYQGREKFWGALTYPYRQIHRHNSLKQKFTRQVAASE